MEPERRTLEAARRGDGDAFERLVDPYRRELRAHCYRMLGSVHDADDALQEALLGAWRGLPGFEGRSSLRSWLYRIATHACLRVLARRPKRVLSWDQGPPAASPHELGEPIGEPVWIEPFLEEREGVELAFVAALQHLPATQRAVLILREVLGFSAREVADTLETSVAGVNSALQRARATVARRVPAQSQQATLRSLGDRRVGELVAALVQAWERADVDAIVHMLAEDVRFAMPPLPAWFDGIDAVTAFLRERVFETPWRLVPARANGQLAFACYQRSDRGPFRLGALNVLTLRGPAIAEITGFLDPAVHARLGLPVELDR